MKKRNQTPIILSCIMALCLVLSCSGCSGEFFSSKITPEQLNGLADQVDALTGNLTMYQAQVTLMSEQMQQAGMLGPNDVAKVAKLNLEIDKAKTQITDVAAAIRNGTYNPNDDTLLTILKAVQAANAATAPWNPYATYIGLASTLLLGILGLFAKKKSNQAKLATKTLRATVKAIELAPAESQAGIKANVAIKLDAADISNEGKALITAAKTG